VPRYREILEQVRDAVAALKQAGLLALSGQQSFRVVRKKVRGHEIEQKVAVTEYMALRI
jgi:hypothetical protein